VTESLLPFTEPTHRIDPHLNAVLELLKIGRNKDTLKLLVNQLHMVADNKESQEALLNLKGAQAARMVPLLQLVSVCTKCGYERCSLACAQCASWYDRKPWNRTFENCRRQVVSMFVKLSVASGVLPKDLFIRGVNIGDDRDPWTGGGFADVFRGRYHGVEVAVKRLRVLNEDKATINPVSDKL
jgi:hypothetical protein